MKVLLENATVGDTDEACEVGDIVSVSLHDENGNEFITAGIVAEILED